MQMVFLISLFGSMSLEESRLDTILAQIFHDNSSAIQSTAADFPPGYTTCTKLSPSHSSRVGWMPCAFSIWEPGLGEGVLVLPALKPSLKVDLLQLDVSVNLNFTLWPAPEGQRCYFLVVLDVEIVPSCTQHACVSLACSKKYYKKVVLETHYKTSTASSSFTLGLPQCRAIFYFKSETSCHTLASSLSQLEAPWVANFQTGWDRSKRNALGFSLRRLGNDFLGTDV